MSKIQINMTSESSTQVPGKSVFLNEAIDDLVSDAFDAPSNKRRLYKTCLTYLNTQNPKPWYEKLVKTTDLAHLMTAFQESLCEFYDGEFRNGSLTERVAQLEIALKKDFEIEATDNLCRLILQWLDAAQ